MIVYKCRTTLFPLNGFWAPLNNSVYGATPNSLLTVDIKNYNFYHTTAAYSIYVYYYIYITVSALFLNPCVF